MQYYKLMKTVLNVIKVSDNAHLRFRTGDHIIDALICMRFNMNKTNIVTEEEWYIT